MQRSHQMKSSGSLMFLPGCDVLCPSIAKRRTKNGIYLFYGIKTIENIY